MSPHQDKHNKINARKLYKMLTPQEKILYEKILKDIEKNNQFYATSSPEKITSYLINDCSFDRDSIYRLFKKITIASEE